MPTLFTQTRQYAARRFHLDVREIECECDMTFDVMCEDQSSRGVTLRKLCELPAFVFPTILNHDGIHR